MGERSFQDTDLGAEKQGDIEVILIRGARL